jgi:hypothetical protein
MEGGVGGAIPGAALRSHRRVDTGLGDLGDRRIPWFGVVAVEDSESIYQDMVYLSNVKCWSKNNELWGGTHRFVGKGYTTVCLLVPDDISCE